MTRSNGPVAGPTVVVGVGVSAPAAAPVTVTVTVTVSARQAVRKARISRTVAASGCRGLRSCVYMMGAAPSQRAARRIGRRAGHTPATQTGIRRLATGVISLIVVVASAAAVSRIHGSAIWRRSSLRWVT